MELVNCMKKELYMLNSSDIRQFDEFASSIDGIIKFTMGEPDFNTPQHIKDSAIKSINSNRTHYEASNGSKELRQAVVDFLSKKYNQNYIADEIIITNGATEAIYTALSSILNKDDIVIIPTPAFPLYAAITLLNGAKPVFIDTSKNNFVLSKDMLQLAINEHGEAVKAVVLNYPSNPTGTTYSQTQLDELADVIKGKNIFAICDEIYSEINYTNEHATMVKTLKEQTILINGVSKSHAMTGFRIGLLCAPLEIIKELSKIHQFTVTTTATICQDAALEAFKNGFDDAKSMKDEYKKRGDYLYNELNSLGFKCLKPQGAFYIFAKIPPQLNQNDKEFIYDLAKNAKVAVISGSSFGAGGEGYIRISYAASMENIIEACKRIKTFVQNS